MKIFLVFKTHFDIGFTDLSEKIINQYAGEMLSQVVETCDGTSGMGALKYVWTMPSWPLTVMQRSGTEQRKALDRLVKNGQIAWHALPFTSHFDFGSVEEAIQGLSYAKNLAQEYGKKLPISAKMTDVPGHGRLLPTILAGAGVKFLHLGCNEFATPPEVPPLFYWQGPDGARVLTMYGAGGYGSTVTPPEGWPYPVWMALMHTHDNCGPQTTGMLHRIVEDVQAKCPDAEIACSTMDDFYKALSKCDLSALPIVTGDLADSWIHGAGSYPAEVAIVRKTRRDLAALGTAAALAGVDVSPDMRTAFDDLILFDEHTWGLDVKTWLPIDRVYEKQTFLAAKETSSYRRMEASWNEQRIRARRAAERTASACAALSEDERAIVNPNGASFTGWAWSDEQSGKRICGENRIFVKDMPPLSAAEVPKDEVAMTLAMQDGILQNHRYILRIDQQRGVITELFDKHLDRALLRERDGVSVFAYRYDRYGMDDLTEYLRDYAYRFSDWGIRDNGRDNYPECSHLVLQPTFESLSIDGCTVSLCYRGAGFAQYGDGERIIVSVALPPQGEEIFVRVQMQNKAETPFVESGSLALPMAMDAPRWKLNKNGDLLDPSADIVNRANHALYCLEAFACAEEEGSGLCAVTHDAPLCAIGETGIYAYRKRYEEHEPILYFNLFNNMWGTNFPQWIGGELSWSFTLFGYLGVCDSTVYDRALSLATGTCVLPVKPQKSKITLPEGVQVLLCTPQEDGTLLLHLRDTKIKKRRLTLAAQGFTLEQTDLRGMTSGKPAEDILEFTMPAFGIKAFRLKEK